MEEYKPAKTLSEQVEYLEKTKRVRFNVIDKEQAKNILFRYNYINVITPFKHQFAQKDSNGNVVKVENKHIYQNDIEFSNYYGFYKKEREVYPTIAKNVISFESQFKAMLAYRILVNNKISNHKDLESFLSKIDKSICNNSSLNEQRKEHMFKSIANLKNSISKYHDIYCFFDRLTLGESLNIFIGLPNEEQDVIFQDFKNFNMHFGVDKTPDFINKVFTLVSVRNCVIHCNSLEILVRFYNPTTKTLRDRTNRKRFVSMIKYLSKEKDYTKLM